MSSFQFPANPDDGDIVVRGNLQAFYNAATNTWRVSEVPTAPGIPGPPGPPGPIGPPGQGVQISGAVDTYANLPLVNAHQFEFWIVDDTNTLYYSDGIDWIDFGSPIQGPQGDKGEDGANGTNGQNGRGWYGTNIITDNGEYRIQFLSNDGLGFTTDNLKGAKGDPGDLAVATKDTIGGIKIGRGLNILPDGTVQSGETYVDLETVPLRSDGRPDDPIDNFSLNFVPGYFNTPDTGVATTRSYTSGPTQKTTGLIEVPELSNGAIVYFFAGSNVSNNFQAPGGYGLNWTVFAHVVSTLTFSNATFVSKNNSLGNPMTHNYSIGDEARRYSEAPALKIGQITYPFGTTELQLEVTTTIQAFQRARVEYGRCRIVVVPYKDGDVLPFNRLTTEEKIAKYLKDDDTDSDSYLPQPPPTPEEMLQRNAAELKRELSATLSAIDVQLGHYQSGPIYDQLLAIRQELYNLQTLPGTYEEIEAEFVRLATQAEPYTKLTFRFE